ncbi:TPA: HNH endonuclease [Serratia fonticola]
MNDKNVKLKGQRHPQEPNVVYDGHGFPIFDDFALFDTKLPGVAFSNAEYTEQMKMASKDLWKSIQRGEVATSQLTKEQLAAIKAGKSKIPDFTWHHHQELGRMQLVPTKIHGKSGHIGGDKMNKGR